MSEPPTLEDLAAHRKVIARLCLPIELMDAIPEYNLDTPEGKWLCNNGMYLGRTNDYAGAEGLLILNELPRYIDALEAERAELRQARDERQACWETAAKWAAESERRNDALKVERAENKLLREENHVLIALAEEIADGPYSRETYKDMARKVLAELEAAQAAGGEA